jgi:hypothetical protein
MGHHCTSVTLRIDEAWKRKFLVAIHHRAFVLTESLEVDLIDHNGEGR